MDYKQLSKISDSDERRGLTPEFINKQIKAAGWEDMGGSWQLDTNESDYPIGGGFILEDLEDSDDINKLEYGQRTVYEVQDVWDSEYNVFISKRKGFQSLAAAKRFVQEELIKKNLNQ